MGKHLKSQCNSTVMTVSGETVYYHYRLSFYYKHVNCKSFILLYTSELLGCVSLAKL